MEFYLSLLLMIYDLFNNYLNGRDNLLVGVCYWWDYVTGRCNLLVGYIIRYPILISKGVYMDFENPPPPF